MLLEDSSSSSSSSSSDEDFFDDDNATTIALIHLYQQEKNKQHIPHPKFRYKRQNWDEMVNQLLSTNTWKKKYLMEYDTFMKLVDMLRDKITMDQVQSMRSTSGNEPIYPELIVSIGIRILGGELERSLDQIFGISLSYVPKLFELFIDACLECSELKINLPQTYEELERLDRGFQNISSSEGVLKGVVGALDGWLCLTERPKSIELLNSQDYYSGHYQHFGLNVQVIADSQCRIIYIAVAAPGKTADSQAVRKIETLQSFLKMLSEDPSKRFFLAADNAYVLTDEVQIPYAGRSLPEDQSDFNFFLSQLRIRVEMALGMLCSKFRIFKRAILYDPAKTSAIVEVAAMLHNFIINEDHPNLDEESAEVDEASHRLNARGLGYLPRDPRIPRNLPVNHDARIIAGRAVIDMTVNETTLQSDRASTARRTVLTEEIQQRGLHRPFRNHFRNRNRSRSSSLYHYAYESDNEDEISLSNINYDEHLDL
jgi:hypothetical protein